MNWQFYSRKLVLVLYLTILNTLLSGIVSICVAVFMLFNGAIILGSVAIIWSFIGMVLPDVFLMNTFARKYGGVHPKYAFFKKMYGYRFPFEEEDIET